MTLKPKYLALVIAGLCTSGLVFAQSAPAKPDDKKDEKKSTELGTVRITGEGDKLGAGTIIQEEGTKSRSTVTRAAIDKQRGTANAFQLLEALPSVNSYSNDATGLFGGNIRVRGFNGDQMGLTINGAPVNDSGNFAVFPQEYVDKQNLCEVFITQGSADNEAPHVGATGGNIGIVSCEPTDQRLAHVEHAFGGLHLNNTFVRYNTGLIGPFKAYLSYSHTAADKFKGPGGAEKDHIDFNARYDLGKGSWLKFSALYNQAINNNFRTLCRADIAVYGRTADFNPVYTPDPVGVNGTAQNTGMTPNTTCGAANQVPSYFNLSLNPFRNAVVTAGGYFALAPNLRLDVEPYYWYGYGTGGTQQTRLFEGSGLLGAAGLKDINGDGDIRDTVTVYRSSVTDTNRPGVTTKLNWQLDNHRITAGYWYERARHKQTGPANRVRADGTSENVWLDDENQLLRRADGSQFQGRNWLTVSTADSFFLSDTISLMGDKLSIVPGIKTPRIKRDFTNNPNEGSLSFTAASSATTLASCVSCFAYRVQRTYTSTNPSLGMRYNLSDSQQLFANVSKGSRVPSNFIYSNTGATSVVNGAVVVTDVVKQETSVNMDAGFRYLSDSFTASASVFNTTFKNRIASAFDVVNNKTVDNNVGDSTMRGLELEAGTRPFMGFSAYASVTYTKSKIKNNMQLGTAAAPIIYPLAGKEFPDTPNVLGAINIQYTDGPFVASLNNKYTGKHFTTLVNDDTNSGRFLTDLNLGVRLPNGDFFKNVTLRMNVSNVFDKKYLSLSSGSGTSFTNNALSFVSGTTTVAANNPTFFVGAPRFVSMSVAVDF
jgi:iron complex outermembrane receptor protein